MRKVQLNYVTFATICFVALAIIILAGLRSALTGETLSDRGASLFQEKGCKNCHSTDSRNTKMAPGLKGLFERDKLPESGRPVTEENVRRQLIDPYDDMPVFKDKLTDKQRKAIIEYLKKL